MGSSSESIHSHPRSYSWRVLFDSISPFFLYLFFLPFSVFFLYPELLLEFDNPIVMASRRYFAAEESEDTLNSFTSLTGCEPYLLTFGELNDSSVTFSLMIPSTDQDMDDVILGKLLTEAHRGQADYCDPESVSVSQSSLSVVFDRAGKPVGERDVGQSIGFGVTRNTYSAHSKFSENTQAEKVVDRSGKPEERHSSIAQIRTLLDEQRQMIIAEYCDKIGHHELQAAHAEEERRILREELLRQKLAFVKFINKVLQRWRNYENSKVLHSIRSQDERSSRTRTLFWNYQAEYRNYKMK